MIEVKQEYLWISKCTLSPFLLKGEEEFLIESLIIIYHTSTDLEEFNLILGYLNPKHSDFLVLLCSEIRRHIASTNVAINQICALQLLLLKISGLSSVTNAMFIKTLRKTYSRPSLRLNVLA